MTLQATESELTQASTDSLFVDSMISLDDHPALRKSYEYTISAQAAKRGRTEEAQPKATVGRLAFLDNLRWALTILVVLHHLSITYGAEGSWYYVEGGADLLTTLLLTLFTALNQGYFMGLFFLIAGYFTPAALDRKGVNGFLKDRLIRLGVPLLVFMLLINPLLHAWLGAQLHPTQAEPWWHSLLASWQRFEFSSGPLWFVETLLIFSLLYVLVAPLTKRLHTNITLTSHKMIGFAAAIALVSIAVRLVMPIGATWHNWQLAFFPQYGALFVAGILAYRNSWLPDLPPTIRRSWSMGAGVAMIALPMMMAVLGPETDLAVVFGGWHWQAMSFAVWEGFYAVSMSVALLSLFRHRFDRQGHLSSLLSSTAYTVYIIHAPVLVGVALAARTWSLYPLFKFSVLAGPAVVICFALAYLIIGYLPGAKRIL